LNKCESFSKSLIALNGTGLALLPAMEDEELIDALVRLCDSHTTQEVRQTVLQTSVIVSCDTVSHQKLDSHDIPENNRSQSVSMTF
jgi:hypothetical protein